MKDEAFKQQDKTLRRYLKPDLVIIDDMGLKALPKQSGEYLLEVVMRRYENRSTIMTSNRPLEDWGKLLSDVPTAGAISTGSCTTRLPLRSPDAATGSRTRCHRRPNPRKQRSLTNRRPPGPRAEARQPAPARFTSLLDAFLNLERTQATAMNLPPQTGWF